MIRRLLTIIGLLLLTVVGNAQRPAFAEASVDVLRPYLGQAVLYTLRTYTLGAVEASRIIEPSLVGFGRAAEMPTPQASTETRDGTLYTSTEQTYVLYPLRVGQLTIEPFRVEIPETPFQDGSTLIAETVTLDVRPLPDDAPPLFRNAIGQFTVEASTDRQTVSEGEPFTLTLTVSGSGNLERTLPPTLDLPQDWRVFNGSSRFMAENPRFGQKSFDYTIFPTDTGAVTVPPLVFIAFNPLTEQYETQLTQPIPLTVTAGDAPLAIEAINLPDRTITPATIAPELLPLSDHRQSTLPALWFWGLWLVPPLITFALWFSGRECTATATRRRSARPVTGSKALKHLRQVLKTARKEDAKTAFRQIETAIDTYLMTVTGITDREAALAALPETLQEELRDCLHAAASGQYAPINTDDTTRLIKRVLNAAMLVERGRS